MKTNAWIRTDRELPRPNSDVIWLTSSGQEVRGRYAGGVVWFPEGSTAYTYDTPVFWRYACPS